MVPRMTIAQEELIIAIRLLASVLVGGLIGFERTFHGRPAGFRTHTLVCRASALLMLVTVYQDLWMTHLPMDAIRTDPTRMAQGIMTRHRLSRRWRHLQGRADGARVDHRGLDLGHGRDRHSGRHRLLPLRLPWVPSSSLPILSVSCWMRTSRLGTLCASDDRLPARENHR